MKRIMYVIAGAVFLSLSGCGGPGDAPMPFDAHTQQTVHSSGMPPIAWTVNHIVISSRVDKVTINRVTANRGNCKIQNPEDLPVTLAFGEQLDVKVGDCSVVEAAISTAEGVWPLTFEAN